MRDGGVPVFVLDGDQRPIQIGDMGQPHVSLGYANHEAHFAERYVIGYEHVERYKLSTRFFGFSITSPPYFWETMAFDTGLGFGDDDYIVLQLRTTNRFVARFAHAAAKCYLIARDSPDEAEQRLAHELKASFDGYGRAGLRKS